MISTSDGSQAEADAIAFAKQYAKEFQEEKEKLNSEIVKTRSIDPGDETLYGKRGMDLKSKIQSGEIKIM
jgi:hypothetical protein|tara:strand:+ start:14 stop:223 length:210 start_codon:yes stop_codon:yes gene_type:complete